MNQQFFTHVSQKTINMTKNALLILSFVFLAACSTIKDAEQQLGKAAEHIYNADFTVVWANALEIIDKSDLDLVYADKDKGNILAQGPINPFSWGENVYIKVSRSSTKSTIIKISSVRSSPTNITAKNWETYMVAKLNKALIDSGSPEFKKSE